MLTQPENNKSIHEIKNILKTAAAAASGGNCLLTFSWG